MKNLLDQHQKTISDIISIQNLISDLDESNLQSTIDLIKKSPLIQSQEYLKVIMRIIGKMIKYRRKQIHCFFKLIDELFPIISANLDKKEIIYFFSQKIILLKLLYDNIITTEDIISYYGISNSKILFFYPEINEKFSKNSYYKENLEGTVKYKEIIQYFTNVKGEKIDLLNDPRLQTGNIDKLSVLIQKDDIDSFQKITSHNNINIQSHKIKLTVYELNKYFNEEDIYMLEYAAYHSSLKIFKFLLMNNSNFSMKLFQYALCGGNNEIIHLSEGLIEKSSIVNDAESILSSTIVFHRNELSDYLIENYDIEISKRDFVCSSIYYANYIFFFNHILEFENEYNELLTNQNDNEKLMRIQKIIKDLVVFASGDFCPILLQIAINFKDIDLNASLCFEFSKKNDIDINQNFITNPFAYAIQKFNNKNAKFLFSLDSVDPDCKFFDNITPFIWACYVGNLEMVEFLYNSKKVNVLQIVEQSSENALNIAIRLCNLEVVKYLVSLDVFDLSAKTHQNETPIQTAARLGYKEIFDFLKSQLISKGIKIDNELKLNEDTFYPSRSKNPLVMGIDFYGNLKDPISVCLLI